MAPLIVIYAGQVDLSLSSYSVTTETLKMQELSSVIAEDLMQEHLKDTEDRNIARRRA